MEQEYEENPEIRIMWGENSHQGYALSSRDLEKNFEDKNNLLKKLEED